MADPVEINPEDYQFVAICSTSDVPEGERIFFDIADESIVMFCISGKYYAMGDYCTHDDGPVGEGELDGYQIICPRHGARFDVRNGHAVKSPAFINAPWYPVRVVDGNLEIGIKNK